MSKKKPHSNALQEKGSMFRQQEKSAHTVPNAVVLASGFLLAALAQLHERIAL